MKSPVFFSKGRTVRFWIQIVLVLALVRIALVPSALYANPSGEQVVGGAAGFNRPDAATLIVNQSTDRAVINWNNFSIANGELTKFVQPNSSSAVLNRVVTANPSAIYGTLQANGNVYLINPGGVLVGAGGVVNTASFVASTHDINTEEFMKGGQLNLKGNSDASVINQGNITAQEGDVFLIAKEVKNEGQLMAKDGTVGMVSGTEVSLQAVGQGNYKVRLMAAEKPMTENGGQKTEGSAEIVNEGVIQAANAVLEAKGSYLPMAIKNTGVIEATGLVENGDGSVTLTGGEGDILNTGVVAALQRSLDGQRETGGSIMMTAKNVTSDLGSVITASGKDGGGSVKLRSADTTILRGSIEVVGQADSAQGGNVQLLGERVGLLDQSKVDATGGAGGGRVFVGGDYLGKNPDVPNAKSVVMASDAKILADATANGGGGRVILWSDEYTAFFGRITALGGSVGGDGGFVETSSKINLQAFGSVNASAGKGLAGMWLLDPRDVTINAVPTTGGSFNGSNPDVFTPTADSATVLNTEISSALDQGTSVTITTGSTGSQAGNILVSGAITKTLAGAVTLTLSAANNITISADIGSSSGQLFMNFLADNDALGGGGFTLNNALTTNGGDVVVSGNSVTLTGTINTLQTLSGGGTVAGSVLLQPSVTGTPIRVGSGAGTFSINNAAIGQITTTGTALSGTITIGNRQSGNVTLGQATGISAGAKNIAIITGGTILDDGGGVGAAVTLTTGLLTLSAAGDIGINSNPPIVANPIDLAVERVEVVTEGTNLNLSSASTLVQLWVKTDGTTTAQNIIDGNLTYGIDDSPTGTGSTDIGATSVALGSINLRYENTGLGGGTNPGNIDVGNLVLSTTSELRNVQLGALVGNPSPLELRAPNGIIRVIMPIFSGGGNITLAARDISIPQAGTLLTTTVLGLPDSDYVNQGVINTFRSTGVLRTDFGNRAALTVANNNNGTAGQISGTPGVLSGVLTLEPTTTEAGGQAVLFYNGGAFASVNEFSIGSSETSLFESEFIRIGGDQTGNVLFEDLNSIANPDRTVRLDDTSAVAGGGSVSTERQSYVVRYFENLFQSATSAAAAPDGPATSNGPAGSPHVDGGTVSVVSARGEIRNLSGGDVNVNTFSLTAVDDIYFDGRGGSNYANTTGFSSQNSLINNFSSRNGRTVDDVTIGNGGGVTFYQFGFNVGDARIAAQQANGTGSLNAGGGVTGVTIAGFGEGYTSAPPVTFFGGGIQLGSARAFVSAAGEVNSIVPQILGLGYDSSPEVVITDPTGSGSGAEAIAFVNNLGMLTPFDVTAGGSGYVSPPTVTISGPTGSGAVARAVISGGQVTGIYITDPGTGYTDPSSIVVKIGGGGGSGATAGINGSFTLPSDGAGLSAIRVTIPGSGYSALAEPTISLSGGGISSAQAKAVLDSTPSSTTYGQIVGYEITDPGSGYTSSPTLVAGFGEAFGNFGEYGVSTEQVDRNKNSGTIYLSNIGANVVGGMSINAPVQTGNSLGVPGGSSSSGSMLLDVGVNLVANTNGGSDGILITGDASIVPNSTSDSVRSGDITITALGIQGNANSAYTSYAGYAGLPVQIGTATGGSKNTTGSLSATLEVRSTGGTIGDLLIYAPAPGEIETAAGGLPLDLNHPQEPPRTSNDLTVSYLATPDGTKDQDVIVGVGGNEGSLTLIPSSLTTAESTLVDGEVTLITYQENGVLYQQQPTILISGGGIVPALASAIVANGQVTLIDTYVAGSGYTTAPGVTITGGGGSGASAVATLNNGQVTISITDAGFGYTSAPTISIDLPSNSATATALWDSTTRKLVSITLDSTGSGYTSAPSVFIVGGADVENYPLAGNNLGLFGDVLEIFGNETPRNWTVTAETAALAPFTNQHGLSFGSDISGQTSLVSSEIERFDVSDLVIGRRSSSQPTVGTGVIRVNTAVKALGLKVDNGIALAGTRELLDDGGITGLSFDSIAIDVGGTVSLTGSGNQTHYLAGIIRDSGLALGEANIVATADAFQTGGKITSLNLTLGGTGYYQTPTLVISDTTGTGSGATATATVANGVVTGFVITSGGDGYSSPTVSISPAKPAEFSVSSSLNTEDSGGYPLTIGEIFGNFAYATGKRFYQGITTQNGDITISADSIQQTRLVGFLDTTGAGAIPVSTATVTLAPLTSGIPIDLYSTIQTSGSFSLRIGNPQALGLEMVKAAGLIIGSSTTGSITLNSDLDFDYLAYPQAPTRVSLITAGAITAAKSQVPSTAGLSNPISQLNIGIVSLTAGGAVSLDGENDVNALSAILTGSGSNANLDFTDINSLTLGSIVISGDLSIIAGNAITQTTDGITVGGTASFQTGAAAITLNQSANSFTGAVSAINTNGGILLQNSLTTILGNLVAGGVAQSVTLVSGGSVSQDPGSAIQGGTGAMGALSLTLPGGNNLSLGNSGNNFTSITLTASGGGNLNNVTIANTGSLSVAGLSIDGSLDLSGAGIQQTGAWIVPGTTALTAGAGNNISLVGFANDFGQAVSVVSANNFTLNDIDDLTLGTSTISGATTVTAAGTISQTGAISAISGGSSYTVTSGDILLATQANNFSNQTVTLNAVNGSNISFRNIASNAVYPTIGAANLDDLTMIFNAASVAIPTRTLTGNLSITAGGPITQTGVLVVVGSTTFEAGSGNNITLELSNNFQGPLSVVSGNTVTLDNNSNALNLGSSTVSGNLVIENAGAVTDSGVLAVSGTSNFGSAGALTSLTLDNGDSFGGRIRVAAGTVTITGASSSLLLDGNLVTDAYDAVPITGNITLGNTSGSIVLPLNGAVALATQLQSITTQGTFTLRNTGGGFQLNEAGGAPANALNLTQTILDRFSASTLTLEAAAGNIAIGAGGYLVPTVKNLSLTTQTGNIAGGGAIQTGTLSLSSAGAATFVSGNRIQSLGRTLVTTGGFAFENIQGMNLVGTVTALNGGSAALTVAGQFYNYSGQAMPFGGVTGRAVVRSLSMMGGLPNQISALAGFKNSYNFTDPGSSRAMIYAVSPLAQFAPSGTTIAGVNLSGTETGGGQFNTFLTGSDNLNWMISDFGRFEMPTVKPSGMDYILYPQRVEPETRTLPAATLGQLEKELGRPPTLDEIQAREVALREAATVRSGAIFERNSFDAVEEEVDKQESAQAPAQVIDGGKPQAKAEIKETDPKTTDSSGKLTPKFRGLTPKPMLRSGPKSAVATLRPSEPSQSGNISEVSAQALKLDAKSVMEQERASAEVGIAPPIAAGR